MNAAINKLANAMKTDLVRLIIAGHVPANISDFASLNDYIDANCLGGADELFGAMVDESNTDVEHQAKLDLFTEVHGPAITIVDQYIKSGALRVSKK